MAAAPHATAAPRKAAVSFTGGKDSMTVLHLMQSPQVALQATPISGSWHDDVRQRLAQLAGFEVALLVTFVPAGGKQSFKAHPLEVVQLQAQALRLTHIVMEVDAAPTFLDSYRTNIRRLYELYGITALATGDILDVCSSFMPRAAAGTGVDLLTPLWGIDRGLLLQLIWSYGMYPLVTCVNTSKFVTKAAAPALQEMGGRVGESEVCREDGEAEGLGIDLGSEKTGGEGTRAGLEGKESAASRWGGVAGASGQGTAAEACGSTVAAASAAVEEAPAAPVEESEAGCTVSSGLETRGLEGGVAMLGRRLDRQLYDEVLRPAKELYGVDECGEWGEFHTMVTDSTLFAAPLRLRFESRREGDYAYLCLSLED